MIVLAVCYPVLGWGTTGFIVWTVLFWFVLILLMSTQSFERPLYRLIWRILAGLALISCTAIVWCNSFLQSEHDWMFAFLNTLTVVFLTCACVCLAKCLFTSMKVSGEQLTGAACFYVLLGLLWTYFYHLLFALGKGTLGLSDTLSPVERHGDFLYFSYVTLSTVGYGDIVPDTLWMRVVSASESTVGQVFLAVLVARSVGLYLASTRLGAAGAIEQKGTV